MNLETVQGTAAASMLFVGVMAAVVVLGLAASTAAYIRSVDKEERACIVQTVALLTGNLTYTLVIPSSYLLARVVGEGVFYSGALIGVQQAGASCGAIIIWLLLQSRPEIWRERTVVLLSTGCSLLGAMLFCLATLRLEERISQPVEHPLSWMASFLLFARFIDGLGLGVILQLGQVTIVHVVESCSRPSWMGTNQLAAMLGIGLGPIAASLAGLLATTESLLAIGMIYASVSLGGFLSTALCYPNSMADVEDTEALQADEHAAACGAKPSVVLIFAALTMAGTRGFVVSGLEAATSILLEIEYSWHRAAIGIGIGLSFLSIMPLKWAYNALNDKLSTATWIRLMALLSILGAFLLFSKIGKVLQGKHASACVILVADTILFPTIFLGDALTAGIVMMSQHLFPAGTWLDANHVVLFREICKGLGRTFGPPLARITVNSGGQDGYALQQVVLAVFFLVLLEICVRPNIHSGELDQDSDD